MHKILVTTAMTGSSACAVHTVVVEFDTQDEAEKAVKRINGAHPIGYKVSALCLFETSFESRYS